MSYKQQFDRIVEQPNYCRLILSLKLYEASNISCKINIFISASHSLKVYQDFVRFVSLLDQNFIFFVEAHVYQLIIPKFTYTNLLLTANTIFYYYFAFLNLLRISK